jgi:hypothetical protein
MEFSESQLDLTINKIVDIEKNICAIQDNISVLSEQLRETQRYLIKLAHNQAELTKRVSTWPFLTIDTKGEQ